MLVDIAERARAVHWLNPESRRYWDTGDSVMSTFAAHCDGCPRGAHPSPAGALRRADRPRPGPPGTASTCRVNGRRRPCTIRRRRQTAGLLPVYPAGLRCEGCGGGEEGVCVCLPRWVRCSSWRRPSCCSVGVPVWRPASADPGCTGLVVPVAGPGAPHVRPDRKVRRPLGHRSRDAARGSPVGAAGTGVVSFAGPVAGRAVGHRRPRRRTADLVFVPRNRGRAGRRRGYEPGETVGSSGVDNGLDAVHFSVRVDGVYVDPEPWLRCLPPGPALWLTTDAPYADPGATRHPRRHLRSSPHRPPGRRRVRLPSAGARAGHPDTGGQTRGRRPNGDVSEAHHRLAMTRLACRRGRVLHRRRS